jgi:methyl-accepting chemotaxis protein
MKTMSLKSRLFLLLTLPLAGLVLSAALGAVDKWRVARDCAVLQTNSRVLRQIGATVHELQRERGRSAQFLGGKDGEYSTELTAQQKASDVEIAHLAEIAAALVSTSASSFGEKLKLGTESLHRLDDLRAQIRSRKVSVRESTSYFVQTIALLLDSGSALAKSVKNSDVANGMACYLNFLQAKEHAGLERATLAGVFASDKFTGDAFSRLSATLAAQEIFLRSFASLASDDQRAFYDSTIRGAEVETVAKMRKTALDKAKEGQFGVASNAWFDSMTAKINLMKVVEDRLAKDYIGLARQVEAAATRVLAVFCIGAVGVVVITLVMGSWTIRKITGPLGKIIAELSDGSEQVAAGSMQVAEAGQTLAEGASEQAASLEETSASLEEMTGMVESNSNAAQQAKDLSAQASAAADAGAADMNRMRESIAAISASSGDIAKIVKNIDEIAFQTNILALNAAVEAARAGEAGAGFAVVADEVRNLAQRSAAAAKETSEKITEAIARTSQGVQVSDKVAASLGQITEKTKAVDRLLAEITCGSKEQAEGIRQVSIAVAQMDKITQSNAASAEESASAAEELSAQAKLQQESIVEFSAIVGAKRSSNARKESQESSTARHPVAFRARSSGNLGQSAARTPIPFETFG